MCVCVRVFVYIFANIYQEAKKKAEEEDIIVDEKLDDFYAELELQQVKIY